jgi:hypothetical protein
VTLQRNRLSQGFLMPRSPLVLAAGGAVAEQAAAEGRSVMQFVHVVALLVDAQRALELKEGLTHREVTLASGGCCAVQRSRARC